jgi:hypothetical protein
MLLQHIRTQRLQAVVIAVTASAVILLAGAGIAWWDDAGRSSSGEHDHDTTAVPTDIAPAQSTPEEAFHRTWQRSDGPVANGMVARTWLWGPTPLTSDRTEPFDESPGGYRVVRYYDKSRMEISDSSSDVDSPWYVTNGLLVVELVSGRVQTGENSFDQRAPAEENVIGDDSPGNSPTYATIARLMDQPARDDGRTIIERIDRSGDITEDSALHHYGVIAAYRVSVPGIDHQVASPFWEFMQSSGLIDQDGIAIEGPLFENPFYATGYPITEAYWASVRVGDSPTDVLLQCFERRCLTWTPTNPVGWKVESGNVGRHYYTWRYGGDTTPTPTRSPTESATATATPTTQVATVTATGPITIGPGAVDSWMRSIVRDANDRVWVVAMNNNSAAAGTGPGELRVYRATTTGQPSGFEHVAALQITATGTSPIAFADAAIDDQNRLHVSWVDQGASGQPIYYRVIDLTSGTWLVATTTIDTTNLSGFGGNAGQGGLSIALDTSGRPRVAYTVAGFQTHIRTRTLGTSGWGPASDPLHVEGAFVWHPTLALSQDGSWYLAAYDSTNRTILATRDGGSGWEATGTVADDVLGPENIDQGPTLLITPAGVPTLTYLDGDSHIRISQFNGADWNDLPVGGDYHTHAPGIGVFTDGTLVIAGHNEGSPPTALNAIFGGEGGWGYWDAIAEIQADGSEVFRWAGAFFTPSSDTIDLVFFDEDTNDDDIFDDQTLYYLAVQRQ